TSAVESQADCAGTVCALAMAGPARSDQGFRRAQLPAQATSQGLLAVAAATGASTPWAQGQSGQGGLVAAAAVERPVEGSRAGGGRAGSTGQRRRRMVGLLLGTISLPGFAGGGRELGLFGARPAGAGVSGAAFWSGGLALRRAGPAFGVE